MAYFSGSERYADDQIVDSEQLQVNKATPKASTKTVPVSTEAKVTDEDDEVKVEIFPEIPLELPSLRPPSYREVVASASEELYNQRTLEVKQHGIHYSDIFEAYASTRKIIFL